MGKPAAQENPSGRLALLKAKHFTDADRDQRIANALAMLDLPAPNFALDKATWKWAAENGHIEDI